MKKLVLAFALAFGTQCLGCSVETADDATQEESDLTSLTDTKIKNQIVKAAKDVSFLSESDHPFVWVRSSTIASGPANAAFIHKSFSKVTDGDDMADKPLSKMKSETVDFESFAARFVPVEGEDADNFVYHQQMTKILDTMRATLKNPVVIRLGRLSGSGLIGAISVYIVGTLPSGKVGGLFTVSVET
ncbi:MAG: nuclease A inhibitor family protein [Polyangiaceae bacterium]